MPPSPLEAPSSDALTTLVDLSLAEDLGAPARDLTSRAMTAAGEVRVRFELVAREAGVAAGMYLVQPLIERTQELLVDAGEITGESPLPVVDIGTPDGRTFAAGDVLATMEGAPYVLLAAERTILNFLQRLCAIATSAAEFASAVKGTGARIYDTRKTAPGMRLLEKHAARCGGAHNHRLGLHDVAMVKDTHVDTLGSVTAAIEAVRTRSPGVPLVVEVRDPSELAEALPHAPEVILLDNMELGQLTTAAAAIRRQAGHAGVVIESEASGGITLANVRAVAKTGVDRISIGAITHSAGVLDIAMLREAPRGR